MSNPNVSVRMSPKMQAAIQEALGESKLATAIRKAVEIVIEEDKTESDLSVLSAMGQGLISVSKAAKLLHISPRSVRRKCASGELEATKPGRDWLVYISSIEKILKPKVQRLDDTEEEN